MDPFDPFIMDPFLKIMNPFMRRIELDDEMNPLERCNFRLTALDLSLGAVRGPYSDWQCFMLVSANRVREQQVRKKFEPHYNLKFTLGLDESRLEENLRSIKRCCQRWPRNCLRRAQLRWGKLLRTATENVVNYVLDGFIATDIEELDGASLKKLLCGIQVMDDLCSEDNLIDEFCLRIITDKLSWLLPKLTDKHRKAELGRQLVKILCTNSYVLQRAVTSYDTERLEFCLRNGLQCCIWCFPIMWLLLAYEGCRFAIIASNALTYLNFGFFGVEKFWTSFKKSFPNESYRPYVGDNNFAGQVRCIEFFEVLNSRSFRTFWVLFTACCYYKTTTLENPNLNSTVSDDSSSRTLPDIYIKVDESRSTPEDWKNVVIYFWRSLNYPYITKLEFETIDTRYGFIADDVDAWYRQEVCEDEPGDYPTPRCLQQHCRVAIREKLLEKDRDLVQLIDRLELPETAKEYLKLQV